MPTGRSRDEDRQDKHTIWRHRDATIQKGAHWEWWVRIHRHGINAITIKEPDYAGLALWKTAPNNVRMNAEKILKLITSIWLPQYDSETESPRETILGCALALRVSRINPVAEFMRDVSRRKYRMTYFAAKVYLKTPDATTHVLWYERSAG